MVTFVVGCDLQKTSGEAQSPSSDVEALLGDRREIVDYHWEISMALTAIHPGEHLAEEREALDMSAAELARKIEVTTNRVTQILNGTRAITGDTALRLAHFFATSAQFWLNLQGLYDLRLAQEKAGRSTKALPTLKRRELVCA